MIDLYSLCFPSKPTPLAVGGASECSERGRSTLYKNPLFLRDAILRQHKFLLGVYQICHRLGTKNFPH